MAVDYVLISELPVINFTVFLGSLYHVKPSKSRFLVYRDFYQSNQSKIYGGDM